MAALGHLGWSHLETSFLHALIETNARSFNALADASHLENLRLAARSNVSSLVAAYSHPQLVEAHLLA